MIYIYSPFSRRDLPKKLQDQINQLTQLADNENKKIIVSYNGDKELANLPENAEIHVLVPGKAGNKSPFVKQKNLSNQIARFHKSTNQHLCLTHDKHTKLLPDLADEMVKDKLFDCANDKRLAIKLFFLEETTKASNLANVFNETLREKKEINYSNRTVRIDYYTGPYEVAIKKQSVGSLYSKERYRPKLNLDDASQVLNQYFEYKSLRCCGLSGLLNLNGLFSSNQSLKTINELRDPAISDEQRFTIAEQFLAQNSKKYLAECLKSIINQSIETREKTWNSEFTI